MAVLGALILTFVIGEIWWFFLRVEPSIKTTQELLPPPQELQPLLPPLEETITVPIEPELSLDLLQYDRRQSLTLFDLTALSGEIIGSNELVKLEIENGSAVTLDEVIKSLKIKISASVDKDLTSEFDIFGFGGNTFDKNECTRAKNLSANCWGPRLGLAIKVADPIKISSALRAWEKTMATDLKPMILAKAGTAATTAFQTGTYQGQTIRYKNLPLNTITAEYALVDNILLITTSKSSMLKAIDALNPSNTADELSE